jgi:hypothetical protein
MADVQILASGVTAAPLDYVIPGAQEILIKNISASFDGGGTGSAWQPAIVLVAPGGKEVGTFPVGNAVAAGASADVSWFPRGGVNAATVTSGDLHWGVNTDTGALGLELDSPTDGFVTDFLSQTHNTEGGGYAVRTNGGGILFDTGGGGITMQTADGGVIVQDTFELGILAEVTGSQFVLVEPTHGNHVIHVAYDGANSVVSFFGAAPVVQQPTPVTLADVIALLRAYGLAA